MKQATRTLFAVLRTTVGFGLLVYLCVSHTINWSALLGLVEAWPLSLAALLLLLVDVVLTSWRLCMLLKPRGLHLSLSSSVRLTLIGTFFNVCLPGATGGDMVRIYYATQGNRGQRTEVATIVLLDRAVGMFALVLWPLLAVPFFVRMLASNDMLCSLLWGTSAVVAVMLVGMVLSIARHLRHSRIISWTFQTLPLGRFAERMFDTVHAYRHNVGILIAAVGISLVVHTLMIVVILLVVHVTNPAGASWRMAMLIPLGFLANSLPITPGGLGVGEAAFDKLFNLTGLTGGAEALLGWRILMMLIGLLGLVYYMQGGMRFVQWSPHPRGGSQPQVVTEPLA